MVYYETTEQLMDLAKENGTKTTKEGLLHFNTGKFTILDLKRAGYKMKLCAR